MQMKTKMSEFSKYKNFKLIDTTSLNTMKIQCSDFDGKVSIPKLKDTFYDNVLEFGKNLVNEIGRENIKIYDFSSDVNISNLNQEMFNQLKFIDFNNDVNFTTIFNFGLRYTEIIEKIEDNMKTEELNEKFYHIYINANLNLYISDSLYIRSAFMDSTFRLEKIEEDFYLGNDTYDTKILSAIEIVLYDLLCKLNNSMDFIIYLNIIDKPYYKNKISFKEVNDILQIRPISIKLTNLEKIEELISNLLSKYGIPYCFRKQNEKDSINIPAEYLITIPIIIYLINTFLEENQRIEDNKSLTNDFFKNVSSEDILKYLINFKNSIRSYITQKSCRIVNPYTKIQEKIGKYEYSYTYKKKNNSNRIDSSIAICEIYHYDNWLLWVWDNFNSLLNKDTPIFINDCCLVCGNPIENKKGNQKYHKECRKDATREKNKIRKRRFDEKHKKSNKN